MPSPFQLVAFWCWYRGQQFNGYQQQQGLRTVQGELLRAFGEAGLVRNPVVAGRTDRGVSARMQVLSARVHRDVAVDSLVPLLNARLPGDLGLHVAQPVQPGFHAAWSATSKEYRYALSHQEAGDAARLREAANLVAGTRDFRVFHFKTSEQRDRTVSAVDVVSTAEGVTLRFVGTGFARHMVRMLVGGLVAVAAGEVPLDTFRAGLLQQRNFHCPTAPAEPLTLWSVDYPAQVDPFDAGTRGAFPWPMPRTPPAGGVPLRPPAP